MTAPRSTLLRHQCGAMVLRVDVDWFGSLLLNEHPIDTTEPADGYEAWPHGWHVVNHRSGYTHRGYPIHRAHKCSETVAGEGESA